MQRSGSEQTRSTGQRSNGRGRQEFTFLVTEQFQVIRRCQLNWREDGHCWSGRSGMREPEVLGTPRSLIRSALFFSYRGVGPCLENEYRNPDITEAFGDTGEEMHVRC